MLVYETFTSLQGESTLAGRRCFFIRLAGCNLDCAYCDTRPARDVAAGCERPISELVQQAVESGAGFVEVTGGEPLAAAETPELLRRLLAAGLTVALETNGSLPVKPVPAGVRRIIDYKMPSSGMAERMLPENFTGLTALDEVKMVIGGREDYEFARRVIERFKLAEQPAELLFSPVWGKIEFRDLAAWIIADRLPVRMQIQLHKIIWGADAVGV